LTLPPFFQARRVVESNLGRGSVCRSHPRNKLNMGVYRKTSWNLSCVWNIIMMMMMMMMLATLFPNKGNCVLAFSASPITTTTTTRATSRATTTFPSTRNNQQSTIQNSRAARRSTYPKISTLQFQVRSSTTSTFMVPSSMVAVAGAISGGLFAGGLHAIAGTYPFKSTF
jgi:hypothetical protein